MAAYNSKRVFNHRVTASGANYNSAPFIIIVLDHGQSLDDIDKILASLIITDNSESTDKISLIAGISVTDKSIDITDYISVESNININDNIICDDSDLSLKALVPVSEKGLGNDNIKVAGAFFVIDSNSILQPLGVLVLKDSQFELLPSTRDISDEVPGMHGEFDFGTEFNPRTIELHVATDEGYVPLEKSHLQRLFAKYLDPTKGTKTLIFSDDIEKTYVVKYSGKIDITQYPSWFEFTLPFKMANPFIIGSFEKVLTGSGTLINDGTFETPLTIEISGPVINPSLTIGGQTLLYTGTVPAGQTLTIVSNGNSGTVKLGGVNAMSGYNGVFPSLTPGETTLVTGTNVTIRWKDKWL
ncbi:MAG TPA: phage tail domain-containing protein [Ruminiclostridium sp.]|nr:phage tail domain-containing protein [Ruminiclostridium sp.]